jgi:hypothetical protein
MIFAMVDPDRITLIAQILAAELNQLPAERQRVYRYLFARIALDAGAFDLVNDDLPEPGLNLVIRERETGRILVAERPAEWSRADEEEYVAEMRRQLFRRRGSVFEHGPDQPSAH